MKRKLIVEVVSRVYDQAIKASHDLSENEELKIFATGISFSCGQILEMLDEAKE